MEVGPPTPVSAAPLEATFAGEGLASTTTVPVDTFVGAARAAVDPGVAVDRVAVTLLSQGCQLGVEIHFCG